MFYVVVAGEFTKSGRPEVTLTAIFTDVGAATLYEDSLEGDPDFAWVSGGMAERIEP